MWFAKIRPCGTEMVHTEVSAWFNTAIPNSLPVNAVLGMCRLAYRHKRNPLPPSHGWLMFIFLFTCIQLMRRLFYSCSSMTKSIDCVLHSVLSGKLLIRCRLRKQQQNDMLSKRRACFKGKYFSKLQFDYHCKSFWVEILNGK